jgi:chorismate dehydratase
MPLEDVRRVALDTSSRTSACLTKIIFREFLGREPEWRESEPDLSAMLETSDCALLIGDPALKLSMSDEYTSFDIVELWRKFTGFGFVFAMWMTRLDKSPTDLAGVRDEGLRHLDEIAANYTDDIGISAGDMKTYLSENISYAIDDDMKKGVELYFELAAKNKLIVANKPLNFL